MITCDLCHKQIVLKDGEKLETLSIDGLQYEFCSHECIKGFANSIYGLQQVNLIVQHKKLVKMGQVVK